MVRTIVESKTKTVIIGFDIMTGAASGATAYVNIILTALFAIGFYFYSRD